MAASAHKLEDRDLASRCALGEEDAARELFRRYQGRVQATLYRIFGSNRDMDDLLQEVFVQVFRSLGSYRGDARLSTWIHSVAARTAYRHLKRRSRDPLAELSVDIADAASGPERDLMAREGLRRFYLHLAELSAIARIAFVLHEVEGLSVAEVAERVGASRTATKLRVWRARQALHRRAAADPILREFLEGAADDPPVHAGADQGGDPGAGDRGGGSAA